MKKKSFRKEMLRKLLHLLGLPLLVSYTGIRYFASERISILAMTAVLLVLLEVEYIRLEYITRLPKSLDLFRKRERNNIAGPIFFICATIIVFAAFDYPIAVAALFFTVFGDFFSALVGIKFGRHILHKDKTLEGFLAGLSANILVGYALLPANPVIFLSMAVVASVVELLTGKLDDNLTVPLCAAFTGQILAYMLHIPFEAFPGPVVGNVLKILFQ